MFAGSVWRGSSPCCAEDPLANFADVPLVIQSTFPTVVALGGDVAREFNEPITPRARGFCTFVSPREQAQMEF